MIKKADMTEQQATRAEAIIRSVGRTCRVCGYDFNNTVVDGDWDGKDHAYECPKCQTKGTYRAPFFSADDLT